MLTSHLMHRVVAPLALLLLLAGVAAAAEPPQYADAIGGTGGSNYEIACGGDVLAGFQIRQGDAMDRVTLMCSQLHKGPRVDPAVVSSRSVGGNGGQRGALVCPSGNAIVALKVDSAGADVNNLGLVCLNMTTGQLSSVDHPFDPDTSVLEDIFGGDDPGREPNVTACPKNYIATGIFGRADTLVHSMGLKCERNPFAFVPTPPPDNNNSGSSGNWSAFAASSRAFWGFAVFQSDEGTARQKAMNGCGGSKNGCEVFWTTQDRCVAFADTRDPQYIYAAGGGNTDDQASRNAIKFCQSGIATPGSCVVQKSACH